MTPLPTVPQLLSKPEDELPEWGKRQHNKLHSFERNSSAPRETPPNLARQILAKSIREATFYFASWPEMFKLKVKDILIISGLFLTIWPAHLDKIQSIKCSLVL